VERTVLITGAGSEIGLAAALEAGRLGFPVVAAVPCPSLIPAVREAASREGLTVATEVFDAGDLGDEARAKDVIDRIRPWAVVNHSASASAGALEDVPIAEAQRQFEALVFGPLRLAQLALPHMRRSSRGGRIVNVSPVAVEAQVPLLGWNHTVRTALCALSEVLRDEVAGYGVDVVVVEPGVVRTPAWDEVTSAMRQRREVALEPEVYDRSIEAVRRVAARGSDPELVAATVGTVLRSANPPLRYRARPTATVHPAVDRLRERFGRAVGGF
jgi:NAD(P)-dependent dehydrogenase (short-subunit alcohol dehydrogenase family)